MSNFVALGSMGRGSAPLNQLTRTTILTVEQETIPLPPELIRKDGSLDVYEDVLNLFRPTYKNNQPAIQCAGWVGYIPLNDTFALEIGTRVPVGNLERLVGMAAGYKPNILQKYTRQFAHAADQPASILDILTDQLLDAFDHIWDDGLLKIYDRIERVGSSPRGRVMPFQSEWRSVKSGRPLAVSSAFHRTPDFGPNRVLLHAFEKLLARYIGIREGSQRRRTLRLRKAVDRLGYVGKLRASEETHHAIADFVLRLPARHEFYADALMIAQIVIFDAGLHIRRNGSEAVLPSILIDMAKAFEGYILRVLADGLQDGSVEVKDGNKGGSGGARSLLFDPVREGSKNSMVTPDIVIDVDGKTRLIIDTKYKAAPEIPERGDINQVILYGARYGATRVMLLHADRRLADRESAELCGNVGGYEVYNGKIDLNAIPIEDEEARLVAAVKALL